MHAVVDHFDLQLQFKYMSYFIYTSHHFTLHLRYDLDYLASLPMCGFTAQLVEHRTGIAEVTGSNLVKAFGVGGWWWIFECYKYPPLANSTSVNS